MAWLMLMSENSVSSPYHWFQITVELIKEKMEKTEYKHPNTTGTLMKCMDRSVCCVYVVRDIRVTHT